MQRGRSAEAGRLGDCLSVEPNVHGLGPTRVVAAPADRSRPRARLAVPGTPRTGDSPWCCLGSRNARSRAAAGAGVRPERAAGGGQALSALLGADAGLDGRRSGAPRPRGANPDAIRMRTQPLDHPQRRVDGRGGHFDVGGAVERRVSARGRERRQVEDSHRDAEALGREGVSPLARRPRAVPDAGPGYAGPLASAARPAGPSRSGRPADLIQADGACFVRAANLLVRQRRRHVQVPNWRPRGPRPGPGRRTARRRRARARRPPPACVDHAIQGRRSASAGVVA